MVQNGPGSNVLTGFTSNLLTNKRRIRDKLFLSRGMALTTRTQQTALPVIHFAS